MFGMVVLVTYNQKHTHTQQTKNRPQQEAAALKALTKADVQTFYQDYVKQGGASRRCLTSQIYPKKEWNVIETIVMVDSDRVSGIVGDELAFREEHGYYK
jgi:hypothetical protein